MLQTERFVRIQKTYRARSWPQQREYLRHPDIILFTACCQTSKTRGKNIQDSSRDCCEYVPIFSLRWRLLPCLLYKPSPMPPSVCINRWYQGHVLANICCSRACNCESLPKKTVLKQALNEIQRCHVAWKFYRSKSLLNHHYLKT